MTLQTFLMSIFAVFKLIENYVKQHYLISMRLSKVCLVMYIPATLYFSLNNVQCNIFKTLSDPALYLLKTGFD